jgi:hypothetical protein
LRIFAHSVYQAIAQSFVLPDSVKQAMAHLHQPASLVASPNISVVILVSEPDIITGQSILRSEPPKITIRRHVD